MATIGGACGHDWDDVEADKQLNTTWHAWKADDSRLWRRLIYRP